MTVKLKHILKISLILLTFCFFINCQKDDDFSKKELLEESINEGINIKTIVGKQIPENITNYLKEKTDNTLQFNFYNKKIEPLTQQISASRGANLEIGTVDTSKSVKVVNETNTKYTFEMVNSNVNSKHNLVVIDLGTELVNYYISYKPEASWLTNHDITKDMRFFTGDIIFYNTNGVESGVLKMANGSIASNTSNILNNPCDEVEDEEEPVDDTTTNNTSTGGSSDSGNSSSGSNPSYGGTGSGTNTEAPLSEMCEYKVGEICTGGGEHTSPDAPGCYANDGWSVTFYMPCGSIGLRTAGDPITDCAGDVGVLLFDDDCQVDDDSFNIAYSANSPFNVDLSNLRAPCGTQNIDTTNVVANAKFMCIYNKLVNSPKFKNLFVDTFEESENLNVKFEIDSTLVGSGGTTGVDPSNPSTLEADGTLNLNLIIRMNRNHLDATHIDARSNIEIAKNILHECIHAFLFVKKYNCDDGTTIDILNNQLLGELINEYYDESCSEYQEQHEFMFDYLLPTMIEILNDVKDNLIPQSNQDYVSDLDYNNNGYPNNPFTESHLFNWNEFYEYLSLAGLHQTTSFQQVIATDSIKNYLFHRYVGPTTGTANQFSKTYCNE